MSGDRLLGGTADTVTSHWPLGAARLAASVGYAASALAMLSLAPGGRARPIVWMAIAALVLLPYLHAVGPARMRRFLGFEGPPPVVVLVLEGFALVTVLVVAPAATLPALLVLAQGHVITLFAKEQAALWSPVVSLGQAFTALTLAPAPATALLVPIAVALSLAAQVLVHGRLARRRLARRLRTVDPPAETPPAAVRRVLYALPLAALLLASITALYPLAASAPWRNLSLLHSDSEPETGAARRGGGDDGPTAFGAGGSSFATELSMAGIPMPQYEVLMEVEPRVGGAPAGDLGPLYLRGVVLSQFTEKGARLRDTSAPTRYRDADDGTVDGWCRLRTPLPPTETLELVISQYPLPVEPQGWNLLFAATPLVAVSVDDVRFDPDRMLVSTDVPQDWFTYSVEVRRPGLPHVGIATAPAQHSGSRYTQLPRDSAPLRWIAGEAARVTAGAGTDHERVEAVLAHFRDGYEYTLEGSEFAGVAGIADFMRRRSGFCTYYASAAVLMLRSRGVAARVVSGFLAAEFADGVYRVGPQDTHAWVEVFFEGVGWVTFDPTPPDGRRAALDAKERADNPGLFDWAGAVLDRFGKWIASGGEEVAGAEVWRAVRKAPGVLRSPVLWLALLATFLLFLALSRWRRRREESPLVGGRREADDLWGRLVAALARRGYTRRSSQTPREFARAVVHAGGVGFRPLRRFVDVFYAARFGERPMTAEQRTDIEGFVAGLGR